MSARRGRRVPAGAHAGAVSASLRLRCDARSGVASQNSLRSLRSLRSDIATSQMTKRAGARRPRPCASRRPRNRPCRNPPAARHPLWRAGPRTPTRLPQGRGWGYGRGASEAPRSAGLLAARASALRKHTRRNCLSAVSEANEASFATGQEPEHRRGVSPQGEPPQLSPGRTPTRGLAATTPACVASAEGPMSATGRQRTPEARRSS
jgi:hypothetical protein